MSTPDPLGHSFRLEDGDLVIRALTSDAGKVSIDTVRGIDALAQALKLALETQLGSDPMNVSFGFDLRTLGENPYGVRTRKEYLRLQLVRTIASDRRVKEIRELYFDDDPQFLELVPGVDVQAQVQRIRASRRTTATIVVETRSHDLLTLRAEVPSA